MKTLSAHGLVAATVCGAALVAHNFLTGPVGPRGPANSLFPNARLVEDARAWRTWGEQTRRARTERAAGAYVRDRRRDHAAPEPDVMEGFYEAIDAGDLLTPELARRVSLGGPRRSGVAASRTARRLKSRLPGREVRLRGLRKS